jgi:hypothetical protein
MTKMRREKTQIRNAKGEIKTNTTENPGNHQSLL